MPDKTDHRDEQGISSLRTWSVNKATTMLGKLIKKSDEMMGTPNPYSHLLGIQLRHKNTAPNSGVEKTMKLYNNILLQEIRKAKTSFTPQG
jgi:hypothetical protein